MTEPSIHHLFEVPQHRRAVASLIHHEFWTEVPGASVERMHERLGLASRADRIPLCLVALHAGEPIGVVNLVDNDAEDRTQWHPWLAGMVVAAPWRGRGVGSALVRSLLGHARRLGFERVYFGTDGPAFYERLGARLHEQRRADFCYMRFELG